MGDRTVYTFCRICMANCGIEVTVGDDDRVKRIAPDKQNPYTWRDFCPKGRTAGELVEHPRRILAPMKRVEDTYVETSWHEAISDIATRLKVIHQRDGADAINFYWGNPGGLSSAGPVFLSALMDAVGTRNRYFVSSVDQNNLHVASELMYGTPITFLIPDVDACQCFLFLGMNPAHSAMNWVWNVPDGWKRVQAAQAAGADLIVVDPIRTATAEKADTHIRIRPGQDWAFLLGLLKVIFDNGWEHPQDCARMTGVDELRALAADADFDELATRCGVPADSIRDVARRFATAERAMCVSHTGIAQNETGTIGEWLCQAINLATGRVDRPGGRRYESGYIDNPGLVAKTMPSVKSLSRVRGLPAVMGHRSLAELADEITTPGHGQIRAMIIHAGNPVISGPNGRALDEALAELDLLVAVDLVQRESHRHAHWLLPGEHWLEREDLMVVTSGFQDQPYVHLGPKAVDSPAGVQEEWRTFTDLALATGLPMFGVRGVNSFVRATRWVAKLTRKPELEFSPRWISRALVAMGRTVKWKDIVAHPHGWIYRERRYGDFWASVRTDDKKVHVAPAEFVTEARRLLATAPPTPSPEYPFVLSNRRHRESMNSWLNGLPGLHRRHRDNELEIHSKDAADLGVQDGDVVTVTSRVNTVELAVRVCDDAEPGVVIASHGWGSRVFDPRGGGEPQSFGINRNLLVPDDVIDPFSQTPAFNSTHVAVAKLNRPGMSGDFPV